jgi:antitoxin HigA-1
MAKSTLIFINKYINKIVYICNMKDILNIIKGVHPGKFVGRELKKRDYSQRQFAIAIGEHPQSLNAIINGRRNMNTDLSLKIEQNLGLEEGFLMTLQVFYDIKQSKIDLNYKPDLTKIRKGTFWDTSIEKIDWKLMKIAVIKRILSYGNNEEIDEINRFYGKEFVDEINKKSPILLTR